MIEQKSGGGRSGRTTEILLFQRSNREWDNPRTRVSRGKPGSVPHLTATTVRTTNSHFDRGLALRSAAYSRAQAHMQMQGEG